MSSSCSCSVKSVPILRPYLNMWAGINLSSALSFDRNWHITSWVLKDQSTAILKFEKQLISLGKNVIN